MSDNITTFYNLLEYIRMSGTSYNVNHEYRLWLFEHKYITTKQFSDHRRFLTFKGLWILFAYKDAKYIPRDIQELCQKMPQSQLYGYYV